MVWPFGWGRKDRPSKAKRAKARRRKKAKKRRAKERRRAGTAADDEPTLARQRAEAMRAARAQGQRQEATRRLKATTRRKKKYVPPQVPDDPTTLPPELQAPRDATIWQWVKTAPIDYFIEAWGEQDPEGYEDFSKWPRADLPRGIHSIRRHVLRLIMEASRAQYPDEFGGMLRVEQGVIEELILAPGTEGGATAAIFQFHMMPVDMSVIGTIHSHPSPVPYPSAADTNLFERHGRLHIITAYPFGEGDWRAFDHRSRLVPLKVVD